MRKLLGAALAATAIAVTAPAAANPDGFRVVTYTAYTTHGHPLSGLREINMRQAEQRARIERGFHFGSITRHEFRRLMAEQNDIQAIERAYVSDGYLSHSERNDLHRRLDFASRHIYWEAHDAQRRF